MIEIESTSSLFPLFSNLQSSFSKLVGGTWSIFVFEFWTSFTFLLSSCFTYINNITRYKLTCDKQKRNLGWE